MKVSEIPYQRYTLEEGRALFARIRTLLDTAGSAEDVLAARDLFLELLEEYSTAASLAHCRFTLDTRDEFYVGEVAYYDEVGPHFQQMITDYATAMLASPYREAVEAKLGSRIFKSYEIAQKTFSPLILEDLQRENALTTEYSKFMSELTFDFRGERMPLSVLRGKLEDGDRAVRRDAAVAIGEGLSPHAERLDGIYDSLVRIRDKMAKTLGYESFVELGYYRMGRMDYDAAMVRTFRENVKRDLVPQVVCLKEKIAADLGISDFRYYDDAVTEAGEAVRPKLSAEGIFAAAREMYRDMDPTVGNFMDSMLEAEAFDVLSREGKWGGGYCTSFPKYKQPFILANFNGSSGDIDVITHEFGHALAAHFVYYGGDIELDVGGMETAECHSMSMEFLSWKYMDKFFGADAQKYRRKHLLDALSFIPYGVIVDEFQEKVYESPEMTPAARKALYLSLEEKYRPYLSYEGIPYLSEGTRWQYQMHIFESPFYYIDYCLAQTVAIGFLLASQKDYGGALEAYLAFVRAGGTRPFPTLVAEAGLRSPFEEGGLALLAQEARALLSRLAAENG